MRCREVAKNAGALATVARLRGGVDGNTRARRRWAPGIKSTEIREYSNQEIQKRQGRRGGETGRRGDGEAVAAYLLRRSVHGRIDRAGGSGLGVGGMMAMMSARRGETGGPNDDEWSDREIGCGPFFWFK